MANWFFLSKTKRNALIDKIANEKYSNKNKELQREISAQRLNLEKFKNSLNEKERKLLIAQGNLENKENFVDRQNKKLEEKQISVQKEREDIKKSKQNVIETLAKIGKLTQEEAKKRIMDALSEELEKQKSRRIVEHEEETKYLEKEISQNILANAIERYSGSVVSEHTTKTIFLPNEEVKGKIIGKEGKNIRSIERVFGVNLVINEGSSITVSCFNPLRREIAVQSLKKLIKDGRINPSRIEQIQERQATEMYDFIIEKGKEATYKMNIGRVSPEILECLGKLYFRTSYGQNNWMHAQEVGHLAGMIASELGLDQQMAKRCGLLHDIGKARDFEIEGTHPEIGAKLARKYGEKPEVINAIAAHHGDVPVYSVYTFITIAADRLSGALLGARNQSNENLIERVEAIEKICLSKKGVSKAFAISAGREVRVIVEPKIIGDGDIEKIAHDIKETIEKELNYPGHIQISVIREKRMEVTAK